MRKAFFDIWVEYAATRDDSIPTVLDLSTEVQVFVNGASAPVSVVMNGILFDPPYDGCGPRGCANQWGCANLTVDGLLLLGWCDTWNPSGDIYICHCTGVVDGLPVAGMVPLEPGDEITVILRPAPGALPELHPLDDVGTYVLPLAGTTPYCLGDGSGHPCPCGNDAGPGEGCFNSTGPGGLLAASGSVSVGDDDLVFEGSQLPGGQTAVLFYGTDALNGGLGIPFGDGLRCVGGLLVRITPVQVIDAAGNASWGPGLATAEAWQPGEIRYFQVWYRDPAGPCGTGFNFTNGLEVAFAQ